MLETKNVINFSEIFNYADKKFGVSWNQANDLFFREECLRYQGYDELELEIVSEHLEPGKEFSDYSDEDIKAMENSDSPKAWLILGKFMIENKIDELLVLND